MNRRLPYIIGSEEFNKHDHLGLVSSSEDEDDENNSEAEEEEEDDSLGYLKTISPKPEVVKSDIIKSRTQVNGRKVVKNVFLVIILFYLNFLIH